MTAETITEDQTVKIEVGTASIELIADQLIRIADAAEQLVCSGLTDRALILLLHDLTGIGKRDIRDLIQALPRLRTYVEDV